MGNCINPFPRKPKTDSDWEQVLAQSQNIGIGHVGHADLTEIRMQTKGHQASGLDSYGSPISDPTNRPDYGAVGDMAKS